MSAAPDAPSEFPGPAFPLFDPDHGRPEDPLTVVTGATGLVGSALVAEVARRGRPVCLMSRDPIELERVIGTLGPTARAVMLRADLGVAADVADAAEFVGHLDRPVDLLIHAGGLRVPARVATGSLEALDEHYRVNVRGPYLLTQRLLPLLPDGTGQVVFCASDAPQAGAVDPFGVHHAVTAAGARALADQLRAELAPRGIRVLTAGTADPPGEDPSGFLSSLAAGLLDALGAAPLDVVELRARPASRRAATGQR